MPSIASEDSHLRQPQQIILLSPMIGVTAFARFAGLAGLPSVFPAFARAAWLNVAPEFNPFKYNSFPVKAARQSWLLSQALQQQIIRAARQGELKALPPILTFQSVMDSTVSTRAVVESLYRYLPDNGSELVVFDINRCGGSPGPVSPCALCGGEYAAAPGAAGLYHHGGDQRDGTHAADRRPDHAGPGTGRASLSFTPASAGGYVLFVACGGAVSLSDSLYGREPDEKNRYGISPRAPFHCAERPGR